MRVSKFIKPVQKIEGEMEALYAHNMHNNPRFFFFFNILLDTVYEQQSILKSKTLLLFLLISLMVNGDGEQRKTIFYYSCSWQTKNAIKLAKLQI